MVGGQALKRAIHIARARADFTSDVALSLAAGVHYDTLMNWYADKTTPRPHELRKVATALDIPYADLMAAYDGHEPEPPSLVAVVTSLVDQLRELVAEIREDRERGQDAAEAMIRASEALVSLQSQRSAGAPTGRPEPGADRRD